MEKETDEEITDGYKHVQHKEQQDADGKNDQQESSSAARMQTGEGLSVSGREREAGFMTVYGFVLCTVILEGTADFRHTGAEGVYHRLPAEDRERHSGRELL